MATIENLIELKNKLSPLYKKLLKDSKDDIMNGERTIIGKKGYSDFLEMKISDYNKFRTYVKYIRKFKDWYIDSNASDSDTSEYKKFINYAVIGAQYVYNTFNKWKDNDVYKSVFYNVYIYLKEIKKRKESLDKVNDIISTK